MSLDIAVIDYLKTVTELTARVQNRIYPTVIEEKCTFPAIRYIMIDPQDTSSLDGFGLEVYRFQFDIYAKTYKDAALIAEALKNALNGRGSFEGRLQDYESDTKLHSITLDFIIWADKFISIP